jgi:hypothetical protein
MAGRSAPTAEIVEEWSKRLDDARRQLEDATDMRQEKVDQYRCTIRGAFAAGLSVTPIKDCTGLTTSRLYQIKAGRRT